MQFRQHGLLRPLSAAELSDGMLRHLLWIAALHTSRPPPLRVLNEPETSLHPDLLPALARLITAAAKRTQVRVVSHASRLIAALEQAPRLPPGPAGQTRQPDRDRRTGDARCTCLALARSLRQTCRRPVAGPSGCDGSMRAQSRWARPLAMTSSTIARA
ncbi:AAA family ATPase [Luteimonas sp BLCC-B24]|nr:AAA family ATPase [Luteimonas sp. BLCC-B24]MDC7806336.1 AAA family ATPase [Luteimonas sp. BLCC-B24]